eukprot:jgi/Hompol1/4796/HPOL_001845-RA
MADFNGNGNRNPARNPNANVNGDEQFDERVAFFKEFLEASSHGQYDYLDKMVRMIRKAERRLIVNINHVRQSSQLYASGLLEQPIDFLPAFDRALAGVVAAHWDEQEMGASFEEAGGKYHIGLEGAFGAHQLSPRALNASHLGTIVCLEGIVTRCSLVRPKVARSVHYCEDTKIFYSMDYRDGTSLDNAIPTGMVYPKQDNEGHPLTTEFGLSVYRDHQTMSIQEMPERAMAGQLPRPTDVVLDDDLVDKVKPGDRIRLVGTYRSIGKNAASVSATFKTMILANNITLLEKEIHQLTISESDAREIRTIAKRPDAFQLISTSLAPSLFGHEYIKKALLLLMLGGTEKNLENGTHLRGDINMLLIGDPSVGKSQMLRFVLNLSPLAIATTGRGSSGVGLTAAVTQDKETGERTLEAGAMVLADRGVVCIDEFDKMSDIDRVAIHEVMEQQTVTIAKAGIHTSLNARCSVLAAANPAFGTYLDEKKPFENITLPDSLLSRFDLVFIVLDKTDDEFNRSISEHITRLHRFVPEGVEAGTPISEATIQAMNSSIFGSAAASARDAAGGVAEDTPVFQPYNELLHVGIRPPSQASVRSSSRRKKESNIEILSIPFLKKFIYYAKTKIKPTLSEEACEYISARYAELRSKEDGKQDKYRTMPLTPRTLETLIRLATAHAKCRLSKIVEIIDAEVAYELLVFALFKEVKPKKREKRQKTVNDSDSDDDTVVDEEHHSQPSLVRRHGSSVAPSAVTDSRDATNASTAAGRSTRSSGHTSSRISELIDRDMSTDPSIAAGNPSQDLEPDNEQLKMLSSSSKQSAPQLSVARVNLFREKLKLVREHQLKTQSDDSSMFITALLDQVNGRTPASQHFDLDEARAVVQSMSDDNMGLWYQEDVESVMFI